MVSEQPVTMDAILSAIGNQTTARNLDLNKIIAKLAKEGEFDILDHEGKPRSRGLKLLKPTDRVALPEKPLLPGISRRKQ